MLSDVIDDHAPIKERKLKAKTAFMNGDLRRYIYRNICYLIARMALLVHQLLINLKRSKKGLLDLWKWPYIYPQCIIKVYKHSTTSRP